MRTTILLCMPSLLTCYIHAQDSAKLVPRPKSKGEYIILKDSTKLTGNVYRSGDGIKLDGKYYDYSQLLGYKENTNYHAVLNDGLYDVWSTGKIQAYSKWQTVGTGTTYNPNGATPQSRWETHDTHLNYCFLKKDTGQLVLYTSQTLLNLVSDNEAALKEFHQRYKKINNKLPTDPFYNNLKKVLAVYNGGEFMEY
jgi:hypothetical protein